jgi:hypothetical protein
VKKRGKVGEKGEMGEEEREEKKGENDDAQFFCTFSLPS